MAAFDPSPFLAELISFHPVISLFPGYHSRVDGFVDLFQRQDDIGSHIKALLVRPALLHERSDRQDDRAR